MAMSNHSPLPVIFIVCLTLLLLVTFPQVSHSQSAVGQLEQMSGQKIYGWRHYVQNPNVPQAPATILGVMLLQSILSQALNASANSQRAAQQAAQRARLQAWLQAERQRLYTQVKQQRARRDAEEKASMEDLAKAMSSGFDTPMPKSDLASALSDPSVVDMRGYPADKPLYVQNLHQAPDNPFKSPIARKLGELIKENQDARKLYQRQERLEQELEAIRQQGRDLQSRGEATAKDFDAYEKWLASVSGTTVRQGLILALTQVADLDKEKMADDTLNWLQGLRNNSIKYKQTLEAMEEISDAYFKTSEGIDYVQSKDKLMDAVNLIGNNLPGASYFKLGKSMVKSGLTIGKEVKIMQKIRKLEDAKSYGGELKLGKAYWQNQQKVNAEVSRLHQAIQENNEQLAQKLGVSPDSLKELPNIGLGANVPPLPE